jgi:hypothetical protein
MAEVLCLTLMRVQIPIPADAPAEKKRGMVRRGDLIAVHVATNVPPYSFDGTNWGFILSRAGQVHFYAFVTGCPDGTAAKLRKLMHRPIDRDTGTYISDETVGRRFRELCVNVAGLPLALRNLIDSQGYIQVTYTAVLNRIRRKAMADVDNPDADTDGPLVTGTELQAVT